MGRAGHLTRNLAIAAAAVIAVAASIITSDAKAQSLLDEVRLGILAHSIESGHSEGGVDINVEVLFRRPSISYRDAFADFFFRPRVHAGASINTIGDTSQVYVGLTWDLKITQRLSLEASFGGAWHDGPTNGAAPDLYGCSVNFRESFSVGYALDASWTIYGMISHMSNANLCNHNSGLTSAGVRIGYRLN